jgi:hypothetical protein
MSCIYAARFPESAGRLDACGRQLCSHGLHCGISKFSWFRGAGFVGSIRLPYIQAFVQTLYLIPGRIVAFLTKWSWISDIARLIQVFFCPSFDLREEEATRRIR